MKDKNTFLCAILVFAIFAALFADVISTDNQAKMNGPVIALASKQSMPVRLHADTTFVTLVKGDSLRIIGFTRLNYSQSVLVETSNGDRGELDASQLPIEQLVIKGENKGDTIISLSAKYNGGSVASGYTARTASGEEIDLYAKDFVPILKDWEDYNLNNNASTSVTTQSALKESEGKSLEELERLYGAAYQILVDKDGSKKAVFRVYAYGSDGRPYYPTVSFDAEGHANGFEYNLIKNKAKNSWLLGNLPFADRFIKMPITKLLTCSDIYSIPTNIGQATPWYLYILFVVQIVALLAWYLLTPTLLVLLMGALLGVPAVFRPFSNSALRILFVVVGAVSAYWWMIALMAWGMHWIFTLLVIPSVWYFTRLAMDDISVRCSKCGRLNSIVYDHEEVTGTEFVTQPFSQFKGTIGDSVSYDTISLKETTHWSDGSKTYNTVKKQVKLTHEINSYDDYYVTFFVTHKILYYKCLHCGYIETCKDDVWEEVSRRKVGSHTERTTDVDKIY